MSGDTPQQPPRGGLSLYANLIDSSDAASATISRAPVLFNSADANNSEQQKDEMAAKKPAIAASMRFQPVKRTQIQKGKPKQSLPKAFPVNSGSPDSEIKPQPAPAQPAVKTTIADWTGDDYEDGFYTPERRRRPKRSKKNRERTPEPTNWEEIYDPTRPTSYVEFRNSEADIGMMREWRDLLHAHADMNNKSDSSDDSSDGERRGRRPFKAFAPPSSLSFAPPTNFDPSSEAASVVPNDATGEDAYARRMRIHQADQTSEPFVSPPPAPAVAPEEPLKEMDTASSPVTDQTKSAASISRAPVRYDLPAASVVAPDEPAKEAAAAPSLVADQVKSSSTFTQPSAIFAHSSATIIRAPVRYNLPAAPVEIPATEAELEERLAEDEEAPESTETDAGPSEAPRSNRPGQKDFARRLMAKYGWTKGSGLGASGTGIVRALSVKVEKRKHRPDSEGGGFVNRGGKGVIVGGKRAKGVQEEEGKFGRMSTVVVLSGMVDGMDLTYELGEGNLMQDIGEECGEKYGRVERVFVDQHSTQDSIPVFVKFTSELSALRAVNALEGRIFGGNTVKARFFDEEKFENGVYE